jgi:cytochrome c oxidase subunit IV
MSAHSYEESIRLVYRGLALLAIVTLVEVFISLLGKGHIIAGLEEYAVVFWIAGLVIIALSLYKAYFIVYEFMHMRYEAKGLARTVLLPMFLLVWALIAFFQEGGAWKSNRQKVEIANNILVEQKMPAAPAMESAAPAPAPTDSTAAEAPKH